jgi:hypothetical protein
MQINPTDTIIFFVMQEVRGEGQPFLAPSFEKDETHSSDNV